MKLILVSFMFSIISQSSASAFSAREIIVGGIFHGDDDISQLSFKTAFEAINAQSLQFKFKVLMFNISRTDSFGAQKIACDLAAKGVDAIFGPASVETSGVVGAIAEQFEIPHLVYHWKTKPMYWRKSPQKTMTLNLYPDADILAEAFSSVLIDFDWKSYSIVYEKEENLKRLKDVLQIQSPSNTPNKVDVQQLNGNYGALMKQIHESGSLNIVLDISSENIVPFLLEAKKVQMLTEYTNYFITNLDFHTLDLSSVPNIGSNITSLRLVDPNSEETSNALRLWEHSAFNLNMTENEIPLEAALTHDAVQMFFIALQSKTFGNRKIPRSKNSCDKPSKPKSNFGADLLNHMKSQGHNGTTGEIEFKNIEFKHGSRTQFKLGILEYTNREFNEIGYWGATEKLQYLRDTSDANKQIIGAIQNKEFKIVVKLGKPFCMIQEEAVENNITTFTYEGYVIDLIKKLQENLNFTYKIEVVPDGKYGNYNSETKKWDGLVQRLLERKADMAVADISITYERKTAVDFSSPFMNLGIGILYLKPQKKDADLFSFLEPFTIGVWLFTGLAYVTVTFLVFMLSRINADDWESTRPLVEEPEEVESIWNILNCVWLAMASIMGQGCDILPKGSSTRILTGTWYFFALIMLASYTANLAAFLTNDRRTSSINGAEDLAQQTKVQYGAVKGGSTMKFFKHSNFSTYQKMWAAMENIGDIVHTQSNEEGVARVLKGKGNYAFLMESVPMEYERTQNCSLEQVGDLLDSKGYGIALPMNSPYRSEINRQILKLQESGELIKLKEIWWKSSLTCDKDEQHDDLDLANVGGVFLLLIGGCITALLVAALETFESISKIAIKEKISHLSALKRELLFVFNFFILTKPVVQDEEDKDDLKSSKSSITKRSRRESESRNTKTSNRSLDDSNVDDRKRKSESLIDLN